MKIILENIEIQDQTELFDICLEDNPKNKRPIFRAVGQESDKHLRYEMTKDSLNDFTPEEKAEILQYRGLNSKTDILCYGDVFMHAEHLLKLD